MRASLLVALTLVALPVSAERPDADAFFAAPAAASNDKPSEAPSRSPEPVPAGKPLEDPETKGARKQAVKSTRASKKNASGAMKGRPTERPSAKSAPELMATPTEESSAKPDEVLGLRPEREKTADEDALVKHLFSTPSAVLPAEVEHEKPPDDPLRIGGQAYWRASVAAKEGMPPSKWDLALPGLLDAYFDARPNDRVRGFVLGRLIYNPAVGGNSSTALFTSTKQEQLSVLLDQLWLRFDILRTVFVTAGRQHVKWGVGRIWNPTDFLHQTPRDPLSQLDTRTGTTMVKLHVPWERQNWNFYGIGLLEDTTSGGSLGKVGGGLRAEVVLGTAEIGVDALVQMEHWPKFGADLSAGLGPIDVYGEVAVRYTPGMTRARYSETPDLSRVSDPTQATAGLSAFCAQSNLKGTTVQVTGGATHSFSVADEFALDVGGEYFYNSLGTSRSKDYPCQMMKDQFTAFYAGQHYLALYASWNNPSRRTAPELRLMNLSNLSDGSHLVRLDFAVVLLTHLRVEAFAAYHYGNKGGEFRFGMDLQPKRLVDPLGNSYTTPAFSSPYPVAELGVGVRISL